MVRLLVIVTLSWATVPLLGMRITGKMDVQNPKHVHWDWEEEENWKYLGKFGVRKDAPVYVYGSAANVSSKDEILLVVAPFSKLDEFKNLSECFTPSHKPTSCGYNQYFRIVPCNGTCDGSSQEKLPNGAHFLFKLIPGKTEFYSIFFIFCTVKSCGWSTLGHVDFTYSISVTADPFAHQDPFVFQFPANLEGVLITYLIFFLLYVVLITAHLLLNYKRCGKRHCYVHVLVWLFTVAMVTEAANIFFGMVHYGVYSRNGKGVVAFFYIKDFLNLVGDWFLILVLILVAGGWQVTVKSIKWKYASFPVWAVYIVFSFIYYIWEVIFLEKYPWELNDPLQTWAGGLYLAVRGLVLFYVWYQLYHIYQQEESLPKLRLYKVLFVLFTIWFWYLLLLVFIVTFTGHVTASLVIVNISTALNFLANLIMFVLFCPKLSHRYFQFDPVPMSSPWAMHSYNKLSGVM